MEIFWRLVLAHFLADFTLQTNFIAQWKRRNIVGGVIHSLLFFICGGSLCFGSLSINGWLLLAFVTLLHFIEDAWRVHRVKRSPASDSFLFFAYDQFIHLSIIFMIFPPVTGSLPEKWVILAILFVLVTHFSSIVIYFLKKDFTKAPGTSEREKYLSMIERLAIFSALLLPGWWALSFLLVWLFIAFTIRFRPEKNLSWLGLVSGNLLAVFFGIVARLTYYI
jgi:hypothetical protein